MRRRASRWPRSAGPAAIDVVGSHTLANVCASLRYGGVVAACGLAGGMDFPGTVAPFILRGVTLAGIDSVMRPRADRVEAWRRLSRDLEIREARLLTEEISLAQALERAAAVSAKARFAAGSSSTSIDRRVGRRHCPGNVRGHCPRTPYAAS